MKNNVINKRIVSIVLMMLLLFATKVYAANDRFNTTLKESASQVKREDNITIEIGLNDIAIESGEKGIGGYTASIKFDPSVLEYVETNGTDKWEAPFYKEGLITGNTKQGEVVNTAQKIGTITFKVKKDAKLGETTIELNNFSGSTAVTDVSAANRSIKVAIVDNNGQNNNNQNTGNNSNVNNGQDNVKNETNTININGSNNNNANIKQGSLPKTGGTSVIVFIMMGICTIVAIASFISMKLLNERMK